MSGGDAPLRPLVYTEIPPTELEMEAKDVESLVNIAPEDLGYGLFHALVLHDREGYEAMFVNGRELSELIHMPLNRANKDAQQILNKSEVLWQLFASGQGVEEVAGGLASRLKLAEFRLGKGRSLSGKIAQPENDDLVQHWGNELRIELTGTDKVFTIRVPKIVKTADGWRIAQAIELDKTLEIFLRSGMHLKTELLRSEHYPMPLEVGNFWKYRIEKDRDVQIRQNVASDGSADIQTASDMIKSIDHREGYWIVTFERTFHDSSRQGEDEISTFSWLVTPKMIFPCLRDCRNHAGDMGYLLGYIMRQTPIFLFPVEVGQRWGIAGVRENYYRYEVRALHKEAVVVPNGAYLGVYEIFGSIEEGRESRYFMPGTGIVMRVVRSGAGVKREVMVNHRLIL